MCMRATSLERKVPQVCKIKKNVCFWLTLNGKILFLIAFSQWGKTEIEGTIKTYAGTFFLLLFSKT